jgi:rhamnogalacturonyl hydrolase YesR
MFAYAMSVGVADKILKPSKYMPLLKNAYRGIEEYSLKPVGGLQTLTNVCYGTCIGDKAYYYGRKVVDGTPFSLGPAIMFYDHYRMLTTKSIK